MKWWLAAVAVALGAAWLASRAAASVDAVPEVQQGPTLLDEAVTALDPSTYESPNVPDDTAQRNVQAWLQLIQWAEGTQGPNAYNTLFGGGTFDGFDDHPRIAKSFRNQAGQTLWTTAAGAYQLMAVSPIPDGSGRSTHVDTWDRLKAKLQLPDFSPASQDACAIELTRERGALADVQAGNIQAAIAKCAPVWASLPGATDYAQPTRQVSNLLAAFTSAGGNLAQA